MGRSHFCNTTTAHAVGLFFGEFLEAHRAFIASDRRFRPAAVNPPRFFAVAFAAPTCFAGAALPAFFAAQRFLRAAMIRLRPSGDNTRFCGSGLGVAA